MPEHLRALIVILGLASFVFMFAKTPVCAVAMTPANFERRRNLWFAVTLTAFLAHNFWIYIIVAAALLLFALPREPNKLAMFFFLLFAVPALSGEITGLGVIRYFFDIHYIRLLSLAILLPAFLSLWTRPENDRFGRSLPDKLIAGYILLQFLLMLTITTFNNSMRSGVFYQFIDIFLPYYVASRSLRDTKAFRDALGAFVFAALVLSAIAAFESAKSWLLYSALGDALGQPWTYGSYLRRGASDALRAQATAGHAIPLGYVIAVALAFMLYIKSSIPSRWAAGIGVLGLAVGLIAPMSRGPWVGAAAMYLAFVAAGASPLTNLSRLGALGVVLLPVLLFTPLGHTVIDYLPFVGTVDDENVLYRQRLLEISIGVILQNPFFGAFDYIYSPAMQELKQGQGIIDVVNVYVAIALSSGLVGLSLFVGFFAVVAIFVVRAMRSLADRSDERYLLGRVILAALACILTIIFTVSSITVIPVVYWSVAGLAVAYVRMLALANAPGGARAPSAGRALARVPT